MSRFRVLQWIDGNGSSSSPSRRAAVCLLEVGATRSALAQYAAEWSGGSVTNLGGLPGATDSYAQGINNVGLFDLAVGCDGGSTNGEFVFVRRV